VNEILLISLGTTIGLRAGDRELARMLADAGASVEVAAVRIGAAGALRRAYPVTDLVEAAAARRTLHQALRRVAPRAVIFSSSTSSLLCGRIDLPYAVRLDAPSCLNRPGARNALQHALERRRLRRARLVLPFSQAAAQALPAGCAPAVVLPQPIAPSGAQSDRRDRIALAYTPDPKAKGLDVLVATWAQSLVAPTPAEMEGARLEVFGIAPELARAHLARHGIAEPPGLIWRGCVPASEFRAALRAARVFVTSARWEDFGFAQLEALADGALLVCGATRGPFEALAHARALDATLCAEDLAPASLATALRRAFAMPEQQAQRYRQAAAQRMAAYRPDAVRELIAQRVLPALLS
jgi:glycosyltransferase involved in cell wall biosynthesis